MADQHEMPMDDQPSQPNEQSTDVRAILERERHEWETERALLISTKNAYFTNVESLTAELAEVQCKLARAEAERTSTLASTENERDELNKEIEALRQSLKESDEQLAKARKDSSDRITEHIKQRSQLESEILIQQNVVQSLQDNLQALQIELQHSRQDMLSVEKVMDDLYSRINDQEAQLHRRESEFETQLKEKDEIIESKVRALESLTNDAYSESRQSSVVNGSNGSDVRISRTRSDLYEEVLDLRKKLVQKQAEVEYHVQRFSDSLKENQRRPNRYGDDLMHWDKTNSDRLRQLEVELEEQQSTVRNLRDHIDVLQKRANELDRQNTILVAQFASEFLPAAYEDDMTEDEVQGRFENIQHIIRDNLRLQKQVEDLQTKLQEDLPSMASQAIENQLKSVTDELNSYKEKLEDKNKQMSRLEKSMEYYKMKYEELAVDDSLIANQTAASAMEIDGSFFKSINDPTKQLRTKVEYEVEVHKLRCELKSISDRLNNMNDEKQRRESAHEDLIAQKNELIGQLHSTKETLELKVQTQTEVVEAMEKRLNELDKLNRKFNEQKQKAVTELQTMKAKYDSMQMRFNELETENRNYTTLKRTMDTELDLSRQELAQLRSRVQMLQDNESVAMTVTTALNEFRSAYTKMDSAQFVETKEQLQNVQNQNAMLTDFVKVMHLQQTFTVDKLKTTLAEVQLQRDNYLQKCETIQNQLNTLQLNHAEITDKYESLNRQLTEIDSSDASLESCRKQIQQLRNKITYLERTVSESNGRAERWKAQLEGAEQQCRTFKQLADSMEKNLHENEEKSIREQNRLQQQYDEAASQLRESQQTIDGLRANIDELQNSAANKEAEHSQVVSEWKTRIAEVDQQKEQVAAELERVRAELLTARNESEELQSTIQQKTSELGVLQAERNSLNARADDYARQLESIQNERLQLLERLQHQEQFTVELRQALESENESLRQQISVLEKNALGSQLSDQNTQNSLNQLIERISSEADQLPLQLPDPSTMSHADTSKILELIEQYRRERNEEAQMRLRVLAKQQEKLSVTQTSPGGPSTRDDSPADAFKASLIKLNSQVEAKDNEVKQSDEEMEKIKRELVIAKKKAFSLRDIARRYRKINDEIFNSIKNCPKCQHLTVAPVEQAPASAEAISEPTTQSVEPTAQSVEPKPSTTTPAASPSQLFGRSLAAANLAPALRRTAIKRPRIEEPGSDGDVAAASPSTSQDPNQQPPSGSSNQPSQ
ncbi:hypothetical protein M3Y96_01166800 [Aphelenchoides besseyi]|nr:hypothetical protein M3Y96_01166800 [Aphelenchoides besseyi]